MISNPVIGSAKSIYFYFLFWLSIFILYFLLLYFGLNREAGFAAFDSFVFNTLLAGFGLSYWYSARYISFEDGNNNKAILTHLGGAFITSAVWLLIGYYIVAAVLGPAKYLPFFKSTFAWRYIIGILFYLLLNSFYYVIGYYNSLQEKTLKESELKNLVTEAELKSLKFQINPHFIFNSLNSMSALTIIDPDKAREMILKLAEFLRYTLANNDRQNNILSDEVRNLKLYLDIEKIRFEDKFDFVECIDKECEAKKVPNMILQPLIENAIKHAVYDSLDKVTIKLLCKCEKDFMNITVENNFEKSTSSKKGAGIGLQNIQKRLALIYGRDNLIEIIKGEDIFKVILYIPV